jgi:N-dimethylarginine dimethylaminohydrolase
MNSFPLEAGRIVAPQGAASTVKALREAGVEVIEVNVSESLKLGAGPDCMTLSLIRDEGPYL